jgi:Methyltransferase domain
MRSAQGYHQVMPDVATHWDEVYASKREDAVSWYQQMPTTSLRLLGRWGPPPASVIDVGSGQSRLVDSLLDGGWHDITLVDVSSEALGAVRGRLGAQASDVAMVSTDICTWTPRRRFDAWHDRAVFHFLVRPEDRDRYVATATKAIAPSGVLVVGAFASDGPPQCSGLPVTRYEAPDIAAVFGHGFALVHHERESHVTPSGSTQTFVWTVLRRADD